MNGDHETQENNSDKGHKALTKKMTLQQNNNESRSVHGWFQNLQGCNGLNHYPRPVTSAASQAIFDAIQLANYSLDSTIASTMGASSLLDKDYIVPNQNHGWKQPSIWAQKHSIESVSPRSTGQQSRALASLRGSTTIFTMIPMLGGKDLVGMQSPMCSPLQQMHVHMPTHPCPSLPPQPPPLPLCPLLYHPPHCI